MPPNRQGIEITGASFQSVVEPAICVSRQALIEPRAGHTPHDRSDAPLLAKPPGPSCASVSGRGPRWSWGGAPARAQGIHLH